MTEFLETCLSFPVVIFSGLLVLAVIYWLVAAFGIVDVDGLDLDLEVEADLDVEVGDIGADAVGSLSGLAGILWRLGLYGVPLTLILTLISLFGWLLSYYGFHWALGPLVEPGGLRYALGAGLGLAALAAGIFLTALVIRPLRPLFKKAQPVTGESLRGRLVVVRSTRVTAAYGEAVYEDGGAGMLLDVRPAREGQIFQRGDQAVILDFDPERRLYTIISEDEFRGRFPKTSLNKMSLPQGGSSC